MSKDETGRPSFHSWSQTCFSFFSSPFFDPEAGTSFLSQGNEEGKGSWLEEWASRLMEKSLHWKHSRTRLWHEDSVASAHLLSSAKWSDLVQNKQKLVLMGMYAVVVPCIHDFQKGPGKSYGLCNNWLLWYNYYWVHSVCWVEFSWNKNKSVGPVTSKKTFFLEILSNVAR